MAFIDELAKKLQGIGTLKGVGETWISFDGSVPAGGVPFCGQTVSRALYADLWAWVQAQGKVKTESEWQSLYSSQNGNCQYYSDGDGSTTFRMPAVVGYLKGAANASGAGAYIAEGLPDPKQALFLRMDLLTAPADAERRDECGSDGYSMISSSGSDEYIYKMKSNMGVGYGGFIENDNPIYGSSEHITPETFTVLVGVYAVGIVTNLGGADVTAIQTTLAELETSVVKTVNGQAPTAGNIDVQVGVAQIVAQDYDKAENKWWYRKWSNGFIEQGGRDYALSWGRTFTYPISFSSEKYIAYPVTHQTGQEQWFYTAIQEQTATTLKVSSHNCYISYYCCGY